MDSDKAAALLSKYDKDQSGLMEFNEFVDLCIAMETINLDLAADNTAEAKKALLAAMDTGDPNPNPNNPNPNPNPNANHTQQSDPHA